LGQSYNNGIPPSDSELVTDVVISQGTGRATDQFVSVYTVNPAELPRGYNSSHMSGRTPAGGNILFQDQHVAWRSFDKMKAWDQWPSNNRWFWF
jgi:hypothetical protein